MTKIGCIVQGDLRVPVKPILRELYKHCDLLVLSTWQDQKPYVPAGDWFRVVYSTPPAVRGFTNRNLQRRSTAVALAVAEAEGCTHVLKWRSDMLPTRLRREGLLRWAGERPVSGLRGRIVMPAFRNLTVNPDWLSSFPDLFAFGELGAMKLLWGDEGFDYTRDHNLPRQMEIDCGWEVISPGKVRVGGRRPEEIAQIYDAHVELYALFKEKLCRATNRVWGHEQIVRDALRLIDHRRLGICWFKPNGRLPFRSIMQATTLPWWTETQWSTGAAAKIASLEQRHGKVGSAGQLSNRIRVNWEALLQILWWLLYCLRNARDHGGLLASSRLGVHKFPEAVP